jgi:ADP-glucose type glycogen/starch synthase
MLAQLRARVAAAARPPRPPSRRRMLQHHRLRPLSASADHHHHHPTTTTTTTLVAAAAPPPPPPLEPRGPGDVVVRTPGARLSVLASEPSYEFTLRYDEAGGPLAGAARVIAHYGHSGWRDAQDAELRRVGGAGGGCWEATVRVPASRLPSAGHAELQVAFRGLLPRKTRRRRRRSGEQEEHEEQNDEQQNDGDDHDDHDGASLYEEWDNADGANYAVAVEIDSDAGGLAAAPPELLSSSSNNNNNGREAARWLKSSLLLRVDALAAARALTSEQASVLRALAWAGDFSLLRAYNPLRHSPDDAAVAAALARRCGALSRGGRPGVHVVHVAAEAAPFAKIGGLGDVTSALAKSHQASGALVELVLPKYDVGDYSLLEGLRVVREMTVPWGGPGAGGGGNGSHGNGNGNQQQGVRTLVWSALMDGLPVYLLEPLDGRFWRGALYGAPDDTDRFAFFSRAALEFLALGARGASVDVVHCHDYHTALVAVLLAHDGAAAAGGASAAAAAAAAAAAGVSPSALGAGLLRARLPRARTVLTLHNMAFQGTGPGAAAAAAAAGLPGAVAGGSDSSYHLQLSPAVRALRDDGGHGSNNNPPSANFLRAGVACADRVTTVSPTYAREVLSDAAGLGMGMSPVLREAAAQGRFRGVLNGIDKAAWSPENDRHLPARFSASDPWPGKSECKRALLRELGLPWEHVGAAAGAEEDDQARAERPLLIILSRLTEQKGLPLIVRGTDAAVARGAQVVILGSAPDSAVQRDFEQRAAEASRGGDLRIVLRHDEGLAHRLFAAADALLVPSLFEPCGLTQLIAMRYGCVPVVRATGGLADTVFDVAHAHGVAEAQRNGFVFGGDDVETAVERAVDAYSEGREWWRGELVPRLMQQDHGWARSGRDYLEIYREALGVGGGGGG